MQKYMYNFFHQIYKKVNHNILDKAKKIKLLILDVDGVMSNGLIFFDKNKKEYKSFNVRDNYGIRCLLKTSIEVAIISGRNSFVVDHHCKSLGIKYIFQGELDKIIPFNFLKKKLCITSKEISYIGDDLIDLPILKKVGLSIITSDSYLVLSNEKFDYITNKNGGDGAIREICDLILFSQNKLDVFKKYFF